MKTPTKRIMLSSALVCSILILGLELSAASPKESRRGAPLSPQAPETTFTDDVVINTGNSPTLRLNQNTTQGFPARTWDIVGDEGSFFVRDLTANIIPFGIFSGAPSDSIIVASNGHVGLGTFVPAEALHIAREFNPGIRLQQTSSSFPREWTMFANGNGYFIQDHAAGTFPFVIRAGTGNVGIGTTAPSYPLHTLGTANVLTENRTQNTNTGSSAGATVSVANDSKINQFGIYSSTHTAYGAILANESWDYTNTTGLVFMADNASGVIKFATGGNAEKMRITASGSVGIGTAGPTELLSVNGTASKPGGGSWAVFSDERLKNIKGDYRSGLAAIMKLQPIRYEYKEDNALGLEPEGEHIGFGAQALQKIIPEAVTRNAAGYLLVDNDPILWTMLNAIREQNAEIAELKNQLKRLQAEVVLQAKAGKPAGKKVARAAR